VLAAASTLEELLVLMTFASPKSRILAWPRSVTNSFAVPRTLLAQTHLVSPADLQKEMVTATLARQHNLETVRQFLSSQTAEKTLKSASMDSAEVKTAVSTLSDQELSQLASRAQTAQSNFAAGTLSDRDLIFIIVGIAVLVLIIVAVHHH